MIENKDFSYVEPTEALNIRIGMHKKYSNFSLEDYINNNFNFKNKKILDIGAGDGNLSALLAKEANQYIGVEKNATSILSAYNKYKNNHNMLFIQEDMDEQHFLPLNSFDYVFFIYSSYYTNNAKLLFSRVYDLLKEDGTLILIGPSKNNAWEVDDFCSSLFNKEQPSELRSNRITDEFNNVLKELNFDTTIENINFNLKFPNVEEYLLYIKSTLQYRDSFSSKVEVEYSNIEELLKNKYNLTLTKEIVSLCAKK